MKNLIKILKQLKKLGATGIKQSLEDEGATFQQIRIMREISSKVKLDLNVKIGGCEAKNDIHFCELIKTDGIVAPMVESKYALEKFLQTVSRTKKNSLYVNLESKNAFKNINEIIKSKDFNKLKGVIIGRSDLAGSFGLTKKDVNSKKIYNSVFKVLKRVKKKNMMVKMGGSITPDSKEFIFKLFRKNLLDKIETRNIEIKLNKKRILNLTHIIRVIFKFELDWIKYKSKLNTKTDTKKTKNEFKFRIKEIQKRIENFK